MRPFALIAEQLGLEQPDTEDLLRAVSRELVVFMTGDGPLQDDAAGLFLARLCDPFGLRPVLAPHVAWPPEGDSLAARAAGVALVQVRRGPWREKLFPGLCALAHARGVERAPGDSTCADCAWCHALEDGTHACVKARARVAADGPACGVQEARFGAEECGRCGACCHRGHAFVEVLDGDPTPREHVIEVEGQPVLPRPEGACVYLTADPFRCSIYAVRPDGCRSYEVGGEACLEARRRVGISSAPPAS